MKSFKLLLGIFVTLITFNVSAQTVDEIISKHIDAMGGKDKMLSLKTVKRTGSMSVNGADVSIVSTTSNNVGARLDIEVMGTSNYQVANASKGWVFMPIFRMSEPQEMTPAQLASEQLKFDLSGPFVNYKEKGNTIELKGSEKVEGSEAWNLLVTFKNGRTANYFIDQKTNRVTKSAGMVVANGQETMEELVLEDYKQNVDGYWFPYSVTNDRGTILYSGIETNLKVDESIFAK